jgi:integrase
MAKSTPGSWHLRDAKNLRPEELDRLIAVAKKYDRRIYLMVIIAYNGAFRVSELIHLRVKHWNFANSKVSVIPLKKAGKRKVRTPDGRIKVVDRGLPSAIDYPMPKNVTAVVEKFVRDNEFSPDSYLFPGRSKSCTVVKLECNGGHISKRMVQWIFDRLASEAGIKVKGRGIHSLKHARLTEVASKTKDPYFVKEIGRHSSIAMSDHYVRYTNLQERVEEIGGQT